MYYKYCQRCGNSTNGEYLCNNCKEEIEITYRKEFKYEDRGLKKKCYSNTDTPTVDRGFTTQQNNSSQETNKNKYGFFGFLKELKDAFMEGWNEGLQEYKEKNIEEEINDKADEKKQANYQTTNKQRKYKTAKGFYVRSQQERTISDFLTENRIFHLYEKPFSISEGRYLLPDFYIKGPVMFQGRVLRDVYIEHWGRENDEEYDKKKEAKLLLYKQAGITLINTYPDDIINYRESLTYKLTHYREHQINY